MASDVTTIHSCFKTKENLILLILSPLYKIDHFLRNETSVVSFWRRVASKFQDGNCCWILRRYYDGIGKRRRR